jgi:hypothetical protein
MDGGFSIIYVDFTAQFNEAVAMWQSQSLVEFAQVKEVNIMTDV